MSYRFVLGLALLGLIVVPACNSSSVKLVKATGQVTYKGSGLAGATVKCYPEDGPMSTAITDDAGNFSLTTNGRPGAAVGVLKVAITKMTAGAPVGLPAQPSPDDMRKMAMEAGNKPKGPTSEIPEKYSATGTSGLTCDVSTNAADNVFQFDLQ